MATTETILFLAHPEPSGLLARASLEGLAVAQATAAALGVPLIAGLFGADVHIATSSIGACGAGRFLAVEAPDFAEPRYATDAAAAEALARAASATVVIAAHTSRLARVLAGVALRLNGRVDTHVNAVDYRSGLAVTRWFYRQRIEGSLRRTQRPWFLLVDPGTALAFSAAPATVELEPVAVSAPSTHTRVTGLHAPSPAEQTIRPEADLLLVAGAGWTRRQKDGQTHTEDAEQLILDFLRLRRASLGSTKSLTDMGGQGQPVLPFLSHLNQVGQTGSTPRHRKGLSTCCHGEEPHVVGWRFIRERRAVNLDPNCGWARGKADVLYVADAFEVMRHLNRLAAAKVEEAVP
ncbi:MAG TPA: hypothetical protein VHX37_01645 [Acidobacteriaceae bacterium]|jgi:electron transfer flavoprotein alpha subunit|nr:hypothetical protein [Acidobacteriaceae bacterium]